VKYQNEQNFRHDVPQSLGVLMVNLGTPASPSVADVRRFLAEFLSDPRVIELPRLLWKTLLHGIILRVRPRRSAHAYRQVWREDGSPLMVIAQRQAAALQPALLRRNLGPLKVVLAMRYGQPSVASALAELRAMNARRILVLPMYPQYSATTTASVFDAVAAELQTWRWLPELRFVNQYHDEPGYIRALAASIRAYWDAHGEPDRLLFSFHGIPKDYFLGGDPYHCQCWKTARLTAEALGLQQAQWQLSFQSRVGAKEWLKPYTDHLLQEWGSEKLAKVHVVCPGFSADCLETLEEIEQENRGYFLSAGGGEYGYIPALNDRQEHIEALADIVERHLGGWPEADAAARQAVLMSENTARAERAQRLGADH
jgi:ferrochelatase